MAQRARPHPESRPETLIGVFDSEAAAQEAVHVLQRAGMPPDRIGLVRGNIRQAREVAGSYTPQGAILGGVVGILLVAAFFLASGEQIRGNILAILVGGFAIIGGLAFIGALAGRARVFKGDEYEYFEDEAAEGETLISVVCDTPDGAESTRAILHRAGAREIRVEESGESV